MSSTHFEIYKDISFGWFVMPRENWKHLIFFKVVEWANCHIAPNGVQDLQQERKRVESRIFLEMQLSNCKNCQHIIFVRNCNFNCCFWKRGETNLQQTQIDPFTTASWYNFPNALENVEENKVVTFTFQPLWYIVIYVDFFYCFV